MPLIYMVVGEHSGDVLGARLMIALKTIRPDLHFAGVGGPRMVAGGFDPLFPMHDLAVMGLMEILPRLRLLRRRLKEAEADITRLRPDLVVTIDSPGFALHLLRAITPLGLPRIHYVAPQVWAWREGRVKSFPGLWERLLCLLPFEPAFFERHGVPALFVGHPVLESGAETGDAARFRTSHGLAPDAPVVVLMPGSRRTEVARLMPVFGRAMTLLAARVPGLVPVVPVAQTVAPKVTAAAASWPVRPIVVTEIADKHDAFAAAAAALTKSGTSTLELALAGVPMAVTYRVNPITAAIARRLIRVKHVAMVNLLAGHRVVPEMLQQDCTPEHLSQVVYDLLSDGTSAALQQAAFKGVMETLHTPGETPSQAAARAMLAMIEA